MAEGPDLIMAPPPPTRLCTCDSAIRALTREGHPLAKALMWDYASAGNTEIATLTEALNGIGIRGNPRKFQNVQEMVDRYWVLHSTYVAPSAGEINAIYARVLGHVSTIDSQSAAEWLLLRD